MRSYQDARDFASQLDGKPFNPSMTGGKNRWVYFRFDGDAVVATLMGTDIVTFLPDRFQLNTGGWATPTTFDAIAGVLSIGRISIGTVKKVPTFFGQSFTDWDAFAYGTRLKCSHDEYPTFAGMGMLRQQASDMGSHFFDSATLRYFSSRVGSTLFGNRFFVTSERPDSSTPRKYTVRAAYVHVSASGERSLQITSLGFQRYASRDSANRLAHKCASRIVADDESPRTVIESERD